MREEPRAPTEICALWLCGEGAPEAGHVAAALSLLTAAANEARERWPKILGNPAGVRILCPAAQPPPEALVESAKAAGCALTPIDSPLNFLIPQCDVAIVASPQDLPRAGLLPALILPSTADSVFWFDRGEAHPLVASVRRNEEPFLIATPVLIATAALAPPRGGHETRKLADYLAEDPDTHVGRRAYDLLLWLIGQRASTGGGPDNSWERALTLARQARPGALGAIEALQAAHARADALAVIFGKRWRSTLVARSLLLLLASVISGLTGAIFPKLSVVTIPVQVAITVLIFLDGRHAARDRWREKWLEYRRLAETLRTGRFLALCGVAPARAESPDWVDWMAHRAAAPFDQLTEAAAPAVLAHLASCEIGEQIAYHRDAFRRFSRLDQRIRRAAVIALGAFVLLGAMLGALALAPSLAPYHVIPLSLSAAMSLAFTAAPTLYATLNSVRRDLDVIRQAARSAEIAANLKRLAQAIANTPATAETGFAAALRAAEIMRNDVSSWHGAVEVL
jgi:hypothetical protein